MTTPVVRTEPGRPVPCSALWLALATLSLLLLPGCGGCTDDPVTAKKKEVEAKKKAVEDQKKAKKEAEEKDFEISSIMQSLPAGDLASNTQLKPGHWYATIQQFRRNKGDFLGELTSYVSARDGSMPLPLDDAPYRLTQHRPIVLAKKQAKALEMMYYLPRKCTVPTPPVPGAVAPVTPSKSIWLYNRIYDRATGIEATHTPGHLFKAAPSYQYELVVLSSTPDRYGYLKTLPTIEIKGDSLADETQVMYYQVVMPKSDKRVAVPSHPLAWTSVAVVLWDDLDPGTLTPEQQDALLDWLHWGGQIIVSGPTSLAALRASFLGPYLPVTAGNPRKLSGEALAELSKTWTLGEGPPGKPKEFRPIAVVPDKEPEGLDFTLHPEGTFTPGTGKLVAERLVGRGRIAITSFSLAAREFVNWPHCDGFFNGCLLRRPPREFFLESQLEYPAYNWVLPNVVGDRRLDPRYVTHLRYWSRDLGDESSARALKLEREAREREMQREGLEIEGPSIARRTPPPEPLGESVPTEGLDPHRGYQPSSDSGIAGWNDRSAVAIAARDSITRAAGIKVPDRSFVIELLVIYLVVLVPLNWGFFRLLGKVEWAWAAAPIIALAGAVALVRVVQLDIGFVRSRTELGVLEIQGNHPRGHLTRYTALYSSLTTGYDNAFTDTSALALPFGTGRENDLSKAANFAAVDLRRDEGVRLHGFQVESNSTGMIHSEQMLPLGGGIEYLPGEQKAVKNGTAIPLLGAGLVRRSAGGDIEVAWIGDLPAGGTKLVSFTSPADSQRLFVEWEQSPTTRAAAVDGEMSLRRLLDLAQDPRTYHSGDVRLLAWTDQELGTVTYDPPASQNTVRTLIVAHLRYAPLPAPKPDVNTAADVKRP